MAITPLALALRQMPSNCPNSNILLVCLLLLPKQFIELALQQVVIDLGIDEVNHVAARYWSLNKRW